jgi:hypothetical protein
MKLKIHFYLEVTVVLFSYQQFLENSRRLLYDFQPAFSAAAALRGHGDSWQRTAPSHCIPAPLLLIGATAATRHLLLRQPRRDVVFAYVGTAGRGNAQSVCPYCIRYCLATLVGIG